MLEETILNYAGNIIFGLIQILVIVAAIIFVIKHTNLATILIVVGVVL